MQLMWAAAKASYAANPQPKRVAVNAAYVANLQPTVEATQSTACVQLAHHKKVRNKGVKMFSTKTSTDVGMVPLIK